MTPKKSIWLLCKGRHSEYLEATYNTLAKVKCLYEVFLKNGKSKLITKAGCSDNLYINDLTDNSQFNLISQISFSLIHQMLSELNYQFEITKPFL